MSSTQKLGTWKVRVGVIATTQGGELLTQLMSDDEDKAYVALFAEANVDTSPQQTALALINGLASGVTLDDLRLIGVTESFYQNRANPSAHDSRQLVFTFHTTIEGDNVLAPGELISSNYKPKGSSAPILGEALKLQLSQLRNFSDGKDIWQDQGSFGYIQTLEEWLNNHPNKTTTAN